MNKDAICELMDLRSDISTVNVTPYVMKPVINRLNSIIIDLMEMDEGRESETCCACEDCPAMKKVDNLADVISQGYMVSERTGQPFKVDCIERKIELYPLDAEKMAKGGTD